MQFVAHLALVSESATVGLAEVTRVSAALQKQVTRDLGQFWDLQGTVDAFASLEDVPARILAHYCEGRHWSGCSGRSLR